MLDDETLNSFVDEKKTYTNKFLFIELFNLSSLYNGLGGSEGLPYRIIYQEYKVDEQIN